MKSNFAKSLRLVGESEGGWSDNPRDPGGATMRGITFRVFAAYCKNRGRKAPTKADLKAISDDDVREIYKLQYWDAVKGDELPAGIDFAAFDFAVNSGSGQAVKELQRVIGEHADGKVGEFTKEAVKAAYKKSAANLINAYMDRRLAFFKKLATWGTFGKGWTARVRLVRDNALAMAKKEPTQGFLQPAEGTVISAEDAESAGTAKSNPGDVAVTRTATGKSVAVTVAGAAGTAVAASGDRVLNAVTTSDAGGNYILVGIIAFVVLTVIGAIATAYYLKHKAQDEGTI